MPFHHKLRKGGAVSPSFDIGAGVGAGIAGLSRSITLNGQTKTPTFWYNAADLAAASDDWAGEYGETLTALGSGGVAQRYAPTPSEVDRAVAFEATRRHTAGNGTFANVALEDIVLRLIFRYGVGSPTETIIDKAVPGYEVFSVGSFVRTTFNDGVTAVNVNSGATLVTGAWYDAWLFADRSGSAAWYVNGEVSGAAGVISTIGSLSGSETLTIGARTGGTLPFTGSIALAAMWIGTDWLDTHLQAEFAAQQYHRLVGAYSSRYGVPTQTLLRNGLGMLERRVYGQVTKRFTVGARWPRLENPRDNDTDRDKDGVVSNGFPYSEDLTQANWTKVQCTIGTGTGVYDHTGQTEMQAIIGSAVDTTHAVSSGLTPASNWKHILSCEVAAGNKSAVRLSSTDILTTSVWQQFDLTGAGALGIQSDPDDILASGIELLATGRWRCWMVYNGGTVNHTHLVVPIDDADVNDTTYEGDAATADMYVTALQHDYSEEVSGRETPSDYVRTVGDGRTTGKPGAGYRSEASEQNICLQSEDLATTWALINGTDSIDAGVESSEYGSNINGIVADATDTLHGVSQAVTLTAATWYIRGEAKRGDKDWLYVDVSTIANATAYFDLVNMVAGTVGAGATAAVRDLGDGKMEWEVAVTGTAAAHTLRIAAAEADGDNSFAGDGSTVNVYVGRISVSLVGGSYIKTTTAAVTRLADRLQYDGLTLPAKGTIACDVLRTREIAGNHYTVTLSDGGAAAERVLQFLTGASGNDSARSFVVDGGVTQADIEGTTPFDDDKWHEARTLFDTDNVSTRVDGVQEGTPDVSCTIPDALDRIDIGSTEAGANQLNGLVRLRLFAKPTTKKVTVFE